MFSLISIFFSLRHRDDNESHWSLDTAKVWGRISIWWWVLTMSKQFWQRWDGTGLGNSDELLAKQSFIGFLLYEKMKVKNYFYYMKKYYFFYSLGQVCFLKQSKFWSFPFHPCQMSYITLCFLSFLVKLFWCT